ncbi:Predicted ATPase (AAA+ superfamily) [hydrothermal vent metagenome]|uniref:Predicted ATPase (AAA+ superfamily) n=1 Tax=hydrothermal vent metagenome TaxID=652676 RepID=A0A3B1CZM7_9ZZZZ
MFDREIIGDLKMWAQKEERKPLILRGARQVGKTTVVDMFAKQFDQYLYLNLDIKEDRELFEKDYAIDELIPALFFLKSKERKAGRTLIFIDEIQSSLQAVAMLRYFYESAKDFWVIAAGSLLEPLIDQHVSFPVGRVEYLYMKPLTFNEYLRAIGETSSIEILTQVPCPPFAHKKLLKLFYQYTLIGGMPEVVQTYVQTQDVYKLKSIYESLLRSYLDDVEKYRRSKSLAPVIHHAMQSSFYAAGNRIRFEGFGQSRYKSREMGEALKTLERAMLIYLMYPTIGVAVPAEPDYKKSPRLHLLDTGLVNYFVGLQKEIFGTQNLNAVYEGKIAEHIVGQELLAEDSMLNNKVQFWVRDKKQSQAEIDYVIGFDNYLIPIEVKAGSTGRLRSLHAFIDRAPHPYAVRIYSGELSVDKVKTIKGKDFFLLNLPFYLTGKVRIYLRWIIEECGIV